MNLLEKSHAVLTIRKLNWLFRTYFTVPKLLDSLLKSTVFYGLGFFKKLIVMSMSLKDLVNMVFFNHGVHTFLVLSIFYSWTCTRFMWKLRIGPLFWFWILQYWYEWNLEHKKCGIMLEVGLNVCDLLREKGPTAVKRRFRTQLTAFSLYM